MSAARYDILKNRTRATGGDMQGWSLHNRSNTESLSYVVIASKLAKQTGERAKSKLLESNQYRHSLTLTRQGLHFITVHAESGGHVAARDCRALQLQYLARAHESAGGGACILAGDFNLRQGEDQVLQNEGWRDSACQFDDVERSDGWTWARGDFRARYDRVYFHAGIAKLAKLLDSNLNVIATPMESREATKQRPGAPKSSLAYRTPHVDRNLQDRDLNPKIFTI